MLAPGWREMTITSPGFTIRQSDDMNIFDRVLHIGDIGQPDRRAVFVGDNQVCDTDRRGKSDHYREWPRHSCRR